ncbi:unnamed protein product [Linum tenue]|uniref:Integrator complex subunit 3 N-terminal domain-containing protein n=1 Tax=Linum tenue TaxID=586396 RepID=A0AAV0KWL5_9ROSI|nr:unnamed protein product [Linum tenue]
MESKLLNVGTHEAGNEFESSLRQAFMELEPRLRPPFSIAIPTPQEYSQLNHALLYGVLTEPQFAKIHVKHLHGLVSDGYALFVSLTLRVVLELYNKLVDSVKQQLIWAVNEIVGVFGVGFDGLLVGLLRHTDLVHVPEFRNIWKDLVLDPTTFGTEGFSDVGQLYSTRTSSRYFLLRVTPEMELQLRFLLVHVKFRHLKRYQTWFAKKFLFEPERETLIVDMIRFICCAHHPSNEIIHSDSVPRWAIIGWLLSSFRKKYVEANAKLALFYDWLYFDERMDNIMNIEPAMLLMVCSMPQYVGMTQSLLEFLLLLVDNYDQMRSYTVANGVSLAFNSLVTKGVINNVDTLTSCDALSPFLKERLKKLLSSTNETLPHQLCPSRLPHCSADASHLETPASNPKHEPAGA